MLITLINLQIKKARNGQCILKLTLAWKRKFTRFMQWGYFFYSMHYVINLIDFVHILVYFLLWCIIVNQVFKALLRTWNFFLRLFWHAVHVLSISNMETYEAFILHASIGDLWWYLTMTLELLEMPCALYKTNR